MDVERTAIEFLCWSGSWEIVEAILDVEWVTIGILGEADEGPSANIADVSGEGGIVEGDGDSWVGGDVDEDGKGLDVSLGVVIVVTGVEVGAEASEARGDT